MKVTRNRAADDNDLAQDIGQVALGQEDITGYGCQDQDADEIRAVPYLL
jgi:hypothetical protein